MHNLTFTCTDNLKAELLKLLTKSGNNGSTVNKYCGPIFSLFCQGNYTPVELVVRVISNRSSGRAELWKTAN